MCIGGNFTYLVEINIMVYLFDYNDSKCISVYDPYKSGYIDVESYQKLNYKEKEKSKNYDSIVF